MRTVVFNNFFVWRLALRARDASQEAGFSTVTDSSDRFVTDFQEWFALMAAYSGTMTLVGILLLTDVAEDVRIQGVRARRGVVMGRVCRGVLR